MQKDIKTLYREKVVPAMIKDFGYKNIEQVPKLIKISVNRGLGEASKNSKELEASLQEIATITGQQPTLNKARKSVAGFKIRDGMPVGGSVTLRQGQMYNFLNYFLILLTTALNLRFRTCLSPLK